MRSFFNSIRFRMVAIYFAVMLLAFVTISSIVSGIVETTLVWQRVEEQRTEAVRLANEIADDYLERNVLKVYRRANQWAREEMNGGRVLLFDTNAVVTLDTGSLLNGQRLLYREIYEVLNPDPGSRMEFAYGFHQNKNPDSANAAQNTEGTVEWIVYYAAPLKAGDAVIGALLYSSSIQDVDDVVATTRNRIDLIFAIFIFIVGIISLFVSHWLTNPIVTLTNAIRRVGTHGYGERVKVKGQGEIAEMTKAYNIMSSKLEQHDRLRNEFVSNASHELKTPLSTMKILAESMLYQETPDPEMSKEFFADINSEVDRLTTIINDLLRLVHEENPKEILKIEQVELDMLVSRVAGRLTPIAKQKGISLITKLIPVSIQGDTARLEQVCTNLIDNALKYTDHGSIQITLKSDGLYAWFTVQDTGIGIPEEAIPQLFERFYRVDKARSRSTGGTGLGLSIVERIVDMHKGEIRVDSVLGVGTTFTVLLPILQREEQL